MSDGGRSNGRGGRGGREGRSDGRGRNNRNHNGRGALTAGRGGSKMPVEDLERKVNSGLMSARAPPKVTAAAARDRSDNANAATCKNDICPSLPKKDENEENNGKVSRGGVGALVGGNEDGVAAKSSSKAQVVVGTVQATEEMSIQGKAAGGTKNSLRANFSWSDEADDQNNDISGGGGYGNRKTGNASVNGKTRGGAGSGSKSNAGGNVIAPTAVNTTNDLGDAVPQNIHARARNRRSNSNSSTAVGPNSLSSDLATTIINSTTTEKKTKKKKIRPKLTPSMDDLTASVEDDDYALWTAPSPLPPSPPPSSAKNESCDNPTPLSTPSSTKNESDNPMRFSSASLGPSPAKLKKGITNILFMNGGEDSIMSMNSSMDDGTTLSRASSSKAPDAKKKTKKKKKKKDTTTSSSPKQPSTSTITTTDDTNTKSPPKQKGKQRFSIDTTITTSSSNESTSPIAMIISPYLSENSIAIRQKATQLLLRQTSERRSSSISTSTEEWNEKSKSFLIQISNENEIISPTLMEKKVLIDVSNGQEKEDVKVEEVVVEEWPVQGNTSKDECCSLCVLS